MSGSVISGFINWEKGGGGGGEGFIFSFLKAFVRFPSPPPPRRGAVLEKAKWIKLSLNMHFIVNHLQVKRIRSQFVKWRKKKNLPHLKNSLLKLH